MKTELGTAHKFQCSLSEAREVHSLPSEWGLYLSPRNHACVLGKERALHTVFCVSISLLFMANAPKMKEEGCSNQNPSPIFPFFPPLSFLWFICHLHSSLLTKTTINKPTETLVICLYCYLLFWFYCKCVKLSCPGWWLQRESHRCSDRPKWF